jgi:hypothetical protein
VFWELHRVTVSHLSCTPHIVRRFYTLLSVLSAHDVVKRDISTSKVAGKHHPAYRLREMPLLGGWLNRDPRANVTWTPSRDLSRRAMMSPIAPRHLLP